MKGLASHSSPVPDPRAGFVLTVVDGRRGLHV